MALSYKYPIFPDKATQQKLAEALDACRWLHNKLLEKMNEAKEKGIKLKTYDTQNMILECTPDSRQVVKQQYLKPPPIRTDQVICIPKPNAVFCYCRPSR